MNPFGSFTDVDLPGGRARIADLRTFAAAAGCDLARLPYSIRVLLENALRHCGFGVVSEEDVLAVAEWGAAAVRRPELAFMPARVLLQDFTGVPCVVDLAALRSAISRLGGDPAAIDPEVPADLVIDHSVQVDYAGVPDACKRNMDLEMQRNAERYSLLRWAQGEFQNLRVIPPGTGIVHQVNLEYLAEVVRRDGPRPGVTAAERAASAARGAADPREAPAGRDTGRPAGAAAGAADARATFAGSVPVGRDVGQSTGARVPWVYPDTVVGTDSHTTMINGLGVLGWGVGGIEAEAVMLGQPYFMLVPQVVGVRLIGALSERATATDLVLTATEFLRRVGVVGRFVEFFGPGAERLTVADRATVANMAPEYGATCGFFPTDRATVDYLRRTGRSDGLCALVEEYGRRQALWREPGDPVPEYSETLELDLGEVRPSLAGPRRPQDRVPLDAMPERFREQLPSLLPATPAAKPPPEGDGRPRSPTKAVQIEIDGRRITIADGHVAIASITSCTNTSNPVLMLAAGLLARNAVQKGLKPAPGVRTSMAPGSRAVTGYLDRAGLLAYLEDLGFQTVGYGCATCIGNSGPLAPVLAAAAQDEGLVLAAVLSGNRNFEARIHPLVRANYLASPPLVVAYALAGSVDFDLVGAPLGRDAAGHPIFLAQLWPDPVELATLAKSAVRADLFAAEYAVALQGSDAWRNMAVPDGSLFRWDPASTYIREPPFFAGFSPAARQPSDIHGARVLAVFGDSVTTDHISPAGSIDPASPAGQYLIAHGVAPADFNTYGSRRGNHEVLLRGTFANVRLRNVIAGGREGGWTAYQPSGEFLPIFDAAMRYQADGVPLVVFAGKEYGTGSSRDWAAKGPALLGVRAVIAESFERIHRSNLVGMGVLPLESEPGAHVADLGLNGTEVIDIEGIERGLGPGSPVMVRMRRAGGAETVLRCRARLDSRVDVEYYRNGGVLPRVLRLKLAGGSDSQAAG